MDLNRSLGFRKEVNISESELRQIKQYIHLKLDALGRPFPKSDYEESYFNEIAQDLIANYREKTRLLSNYLCPADRRIQEFIDSYLSDLNLGYRIQLPTNTFILDRHGIARILSLPYDNDKFISDIVSSYKIKQGVLHNPKSDRRTTEGSFHIAEGGLPIPADKKAVPKLVFAKMLLRALNPPKDLMVLPYTSTLEQKAELFVSLLLRPVVVPEIKGKSKAKTMEIRFFAPGNLVSNLDFVESIFGNAGDPYLPENDAGLDVECWTGHTGCVILAPHLLKLTKKELGLPHYEDATERQRKDGMCWKSEDELYNNGTPFKITARDNTGVVITIITDNYFGYCKKEVKTQISYAANLYGNCEEEHAGGAIAFASYNLGDVFYDDNYIKSSEYSYAENIKLHSDFMMPEPEGYAIDKNFPNIIYVPENAKFDLNRQEVYWEKDDKEIALKLLSKNRYVYPSGYKIRMEKNPALPIWRLVGTVPEGVFCHKPCTVSGGGKSEISKSINDAIIFGPYFVADIHKDLDQVDEILNKDYGDRFKVKKPKDRPSRPILSPERSLGSVIKLLTPSPDEYSEEYNKWLESIPPYIKGIVFIIKRHYKPEWGPNWREHFSVDAINGTLGNELKFDNRKLVANYLRVGLQKDKSWRTFKLRLDFIAADKIQMEDDITASTVLPSESLEYLPDIYKNRSVKITQNCEYRFFQRPDDAIHRGYDKQAEKDIASPNTFLCNFEPLTLNDAKKIVEDEINFDKFTEPMKNFIREVYEKRDCVYFVSSAHPRMIDGKPSVNMRYLQHRPDIIDPMPKYLAEVGVRLARKIPSNKPVNFVVDAVLPGRRNNPADKKNGIKPLAVYNPIHYQELPELFIDFIASLTGKSPSTTGAGSEGAMTKGPFNNLPQIFDLNAALISYILTEYKVFSTPAHYIGPNYRIDHDISLLIPEIWCRLRPEERDPKFLIETGCFEKLNDFEYKGEKILASRLGYRMTAKFAHDYFGRVFENPIVVFNEEMLKPELQDMDHFVEGIKNITESQKRVALLYFEDGSVNYAIPPLKVLLNIMAFGTYDNKTLEDPELRKMFTKEYLLNSDWYKERIKFKKEIDKKLIEKKIKNLKDFLADPRSIEISHKIRINEKLQTAEKIMHNIDSPEYDKELEGTIGAEPLLYKV